MNTFFQTNFTPLGSSISLAPYSTLDLRLDLASSSLNVTPTTDFSVQLVNAQNRTSVARRISQFVSLTGPVGGPGGPHSMLQTARIPLLAFGMPLSAIRGVRLTFHVTPTGAVYVANIRATVSTSTSSLQTSNAVIASAPSAPLSSPVSAARTIVQGQIVSMGATLTTQTAAGSMDIEVSSNTPFPVIDDLLVLHVGSVSAGLSRYPDSSNMRRLIFTLTPPQIASLRTGDQVTVTGGRTVWQLGSLKL
jgi:hypothetical protein